MQRLTMPILMNQNEMYHLSVEWRNTCARVVDRHTSIFWLWTKDCGLARNSEYPAQPQPITICRYDGCLKPFHRRSANTYWTKRAHHSLIYQRNNHLLGNDNSYQDRAWFMPSHPFDLRNRMESADSAPHRRKLRGGGRIMRCQAWFSSNFACLFFQRDSGGN